MLAALLASLALCGSHSVVHDVKTNLPRQGVWLEGPERKRLHESRCGFADHVAEAGYWALQEVHDEAPEEEDLPVTVRAGWRTAEHWKMGWVSTPVERPIEGGQEVIATSYAATMRRGRERVSFKFRVAAQ